MPSQDSFGAKSTLDVDGKAYEIYRLDAVTGDGLDAAGLPFIHLPSPEGLSVFREWMDKPDKIPY